MWATLIPLAAGAAVWWWLWSGYEREFAATLQPWLPAGTAIKTGGFPYRLQAEIAPLAVSHDGEALSAQLSAEVAVANRVPWQRNHMVLNFKEPRLELALKPIASARIAIAAPAAQASLRTTSGRI